MRAPEPRRSRNKGALSVEEAPRAANSARALGRVAHGAVTLTPAEEDVGVAIELAAQSRHPLQNCLYLALALRLEVPFVTADRAFIGRARAVLPRIADLRGGDA